MKITQPQMSSRLHKTSAYSSPFVFIKQLREINTRQRGVSFPGSGGGNICISGIPHNLQHKRAQKQEDWCNIRSTSINLTFPVENRPEISFPKIPRTQILPTQVPWNLKTACEVDTFSIFHFNQLRNRGTQGTNVGSHKLKRKMKDSGHKEKWSAFQPGRELGC